MHTCVHTHIHKYTHTCTRACTRMHTHPKLMHASDGTFIYMQYYLTSPHFNFLRQAIHPIRLLTVLWLYTAESHQWETVDSKKVVC